MNKTHDHKPLIIQTVVKTGSVGFSHSQRVNKCAPDARLWCGALGNGGGGGVCAQEAYVLKGWDRNKHTGDHDVNRVKNR